MGKEAAKYVARHVLRPVEDDRQEERD
jgi:hypothetical protein